MCHSETGLEDNVIHSGGQYKDYEDICGVNPYIWGDFLRELKVKPNTIFAGYTVYKYYLEKTGDKTKALREFKGIESKRKMWIVFKVQRVMNTVKQEYKQEHKKENK